MPKLSQICLRIALPLTWGGKAIFAIRMVAILVLLLTGLATSPAQADVGVLLNESLDTSFARISGSGHSAVFFSRVCPETPMKLRLCRPGEQGSVMSNYTTLGEDQPYEWNIVPLSIYLYGVEDPQNRPLFGSQKIKHALEERYRANFLSGYCESANCRTGSGSEWREMVGATLQRSIYLFVVETSVEQDQAFIAQEKDNSWSSPSPRAATLMSIPKGSFVLGLRWITKRSIAITASLLAEAGCLHRAII